MNKKNMFTYGLTLMLGLLGGSSVSAYLMQKSAKPVESPSSVASNSPLLLDDSENPSTEESSTTVAQEVNAYIDTYLGTPFPNLSFEDESGNLYTTETMKGSPYIAYIVDAGCDSCLDIIEAAQTIKLEYPSLLISDVNDINLLQTFKKEHDLPYDFYLRPQSSTLTYAQQLNLSYYPTTFLIDENGLIAQIFIGNFSAETILSVAHSTLPTKTSK